jgi:hypothetical protein
MSILQNYKTLTPSNMEPQFQKESVKGPFAIPIKIVDAYLYNKWKP